LTPSAACQCRLAKTTAEAQDVCCWLQKRRRVRNLGGLRGSDVVAFITDLAAAYPSGSWRNRLTSQTRLFLRFLRWEGTLDVDLDRVVPKVPHWRLASIPATSDGITSVHSFAASM
jgi:hypothetical protein